MEQGMFNIPHQLKTRLLMCNSGVTKFTSLFITYFYKDNIQMPVTIAFFSEQPLFPGGWQVFSKGERVLLRIVHRLHLKKPCSLHSSKLFILFFSRAFFKIPESVAPKSSFRLFLKN